MKPDPLKCIDLRSGFKFKKIVLDILKYLLTAVKWFVFGNVAIYVATRVINFIEDPYMRDAYFYHLGSYKDDLGTMAIQVFAFMIIFGLLISMYRLMFKRDYKWQNLFTFLSCLIFTIIAVFF